MNMYVKKKKKKRKRQKLKKLCGATNGSIGGTQWALTGFALRTGVLLSVISMPRSWT